MSEGLLNSLGQSLIRALPSSFLVLVLLTGFLLWLVHDIQSERLEAFKQFSLACTEALSTHR